MHILSDSYNYAIQKLDNHRQEIDRLVELLVEEEIFGKQVLEIIGTDEGNAAQNSNKPIGEEVTSNANGGIHR